MGILEMRLFVNNSEAETGSHFVEMEASKSRQTRTVVTYMDGHKFEAPYRTAPVLDFKCTGRKERCHFVYTFDLSSWSFIRGETHQHSKEPWLATSTTSCQTDELDASDAEMIDAALSDINDSFLLDCNDCEKVADLVASIESLPESVRGDDLFVKYETALASSTELTVARKLAAKLKFGQFLANNW
ncbi:hypothetical protein HDE_06226 [Halotydeus destructor]|nr:hypothetical protein HDE_06226 [Halotydeus destructor]